MDNTISFYDEFVNLLGQLDVTEIIVVSINLLLMLFAPRIMQVIYHDKNDSNKLKLRTNFSTPSAKK